MYEMRSIDPGTFDTYLFHQGTNYRSYHFFGAHFMTHDRRKGVRFAVWAPNARVVRVVGDFNEWNGKFHALERLESTGVWVGFIQGLGKGEVYKYEIFTEEGERLLKADPFAFYSETRPNTGSRLYSLNGYRWSDKRWLNRRAKTPPYKEPMSIYEMNLMSWQQDEEGVALGYQEIAERLVPYLEEMHYTHVELMPIMEHPFDGSWGYQVTGYFAATSRFGEPKDFMDFVNTLHKAGIGVIIDWVPCHFCKDAHGLIRFDGSTLYEHFDPRHAENVNWGTLNFDYGKPEVQSFLISAAMFWFEMFHIDGLRVDAVAYMLYHGEDERGEKIKNEKGGYENFQAVAFVKKMNQVIFEQYPDILMIAEESTDWPKVSHPVHEGGLGFNFKWNMGWMNDILSYMELDPIHRRYHHGKLTFSTMYMYAENYILPLSHDEVVHGKKSLLDKMPGDYWRKFANLRVLYLYLMGHPGKKLLFMGGEFGQFIEWNEWKPLDWFLLDYEAHQEMHAFVKELNALYLEEKAFSENDYNHFGFKWLEADDKDRSVLVFQRADEAGEKVIGVLNFTPEVYEDYFFGVDESGVYEVLLNSDEKRYGGSGLDQPDQLVTEEKAHKEFSHRLTITVPPLGGVYLKKKRRKSQ